MAIDYSETIVRLVKRERERLLSTKEEDVVSKPSTDKWSKKETLGHLIDSASNNHQRFVRAQFTEMLVIPGYVQREWVGGQNYAGESWRQIVELWSAYNMHLAHIIKSIPSEKMSVQIKIGENDPMTLEAVIADYVRHLEHHLVQLTGKTRA